MINVLINGSYYKFNKGVKLIDIYNEVKENYKYPVLVAFVDNEICELSEKVSFDAEIEFIDFSSRMGNRIYQKGLLFLLSYAFYLVYGNDKKIKVCHSIDKGIRINTDIVVTEDELNKIKLKMQEIVDSDIPITKCLVRKKDAVDYFKKTNNLAKCNSLKYITNHYINLYKLGNIYDYFYSHMPYSTGCFISFNLKKLDDTEFLLEFPNTSDISKIPEYVSREKIIEAYNENYKLAKKLGIFTASDINKSIALGRINDIIKLNEVVSNNNLLNLAKEIFDRRESIKIVLIAGPSSSGKTTTARKLSMFLKSFGMNPKPLSIDDYFLEREDTPKLPNGDYDFESLNAIDVKLFNEQLTKLLNHEEVVIPTYNFYAGKKEFKSSMKLQDNDILVIEGLHGLNEKLTQSISKENKYKIYVSPFTDLNVDNLNMVSTSDVRLLRRIIRDNRTRGYSALETIKTWNTVRDGEEKYIFPFQQEADYVYNSALIYEVSVLKSYVEPLLFDIDNTSKYYEEVRRLINFLSMFLVVSTDAIPSDSILREFIGGSYFE